MNKAQTQIKTLLGEQFSTIQTLSTIRIKYRTMGFYIDDKEFWLDFGCFPEKITRLKQINPIKFKINLYGKSRKSIDDDNPICKPVFRT